MAHKSGDRLRCARCGTEIIVVKGTDGVVACCGADIEVLVPKGT